MKLGITFPQFIEPDGASITAFGREVEAAVGVERGVGTGLDLPQPGDAGADRGPVLELLVEDGELGICGAPGREQDDAQQGDPQPQCGEHQVLPAGLQRPRPSAVTSRTRPGSSSTSIRARATFHSSSQSIT